MTIEDRPGGLTLDLLCAFGMLTMDEREVVIDHLLVGRTFRAIGETMEMTRSGAQQLERRGLRRLREVLGVTV
jgi:DNA-directed RNA polymerase specialized sigma24 family protein